jgi:hypothetical protein
MTAKVLGAGIVGTLYTGMIAKQPHPQLPERVRGKVAALAGKLVI